MLELAILEENQKISELSLQVVKSVPRNIWKKTRKNAFFENELFNNGDKFFKENMRMKPASFNELCSLLPNLEKQTNHLNQTIPLKKRVAIALYTLGSRAEYRTIANLFRIGTSTVCEIVLDFCSEVWDVLKKIYLSSYPLTDTIVKINCAGFENMGFPQCIGAIDGCHIEIKPHKEDAIDYYNYKGWYSTVLLAVVDHNYNFMYINVGCPGRCNDSTIFEQSPLKLHHKNNPIMQQNTKRIMSVDVPPLLISDSAFKLSFYVMKPFPYSANQDASEKLFNYKLSKCRRVVENAFGHLKARFRRIGKGLDNHIDNSNMIIKACCVLNNFLNSKKDDANFNWVQQEQEQERNKNRAQPNLDLNINDQNGTLLRNALTLYFEELAVGVADVEVEGSGVADVVGIDLDAEDSDTVISIDVEFE